MKIQKKKVLFETSYLRLFTLIYKTRDGIKKHYDGVSRVNAAVAVVIAAITDNDELIFVEQPRILISSSTIELPAGLCDKKGESIVETARRELLEETGYEASEFEVLLGGEKGSVISPGISDERVILVGCYNARKVAEPEPDEETRPILVPLSKASAWLHEQAKIKEIDYKVFGTIEIVKKWYKERR